MKRLANRIKGFFFPALCFALLCSVPLSVRAAGGRISLSEADGAQEDGICIKVELSDCGEGNTMGISLQYDKTALELRTGECKWLKEGVLQNFDRGKDIGVWACETAGDLNGDVCLLVFRAKPDAPAGDTEINCSLIVKNDSVEIGNYPGKYTVALGHSHVFGGYVKKDDDRHERICRECGFAEERSHDWGDARIEKEPTDTEEGEVSYTCTVCGAVRIDKTAVKGESGGISAGGQPVQGSQGQTTPIQGSPGHISPAPGSSGSLSSASSVQGSQSHTSPNQGVQSQGTVQGSAPVYGSQGQNPQQGGSQSGGLPIVDLTRLENQAKLEESMREQGYSQSGGGQPGSAAGQEYIDSDSIHIHEDGTIHITGIADGTAHADEDAAGEVRPAGAEEGFLQADGSAQAGGTQQGGLSSAGALAEGGLPADRSAGGSLLVWIFTVGILAAGGILICRRNRIKELLTTNKKKKGKEK